MKPPENWRRAGRQWKSSLSAASRSHKTARVLTVSIDSLLLRWLWKSIKSQVDRLDNRRRGLVEILLTASTLGTMQVCITPFLISHVCILKKGAWLNCYINTRICDLRARAAPSNYDPAIDPISSHYAHRISVRWHHWKIRIKQYIKSLFFWSRIRSTWWSILLYFPPSSSYAQLFLIKLIYSV